MANRFLNNIKINDSYTLPAADGTADQVITTNGLGQLSFVDQSTITAGTTEKVVIYAKNTHTTSIVKGTPVYITGTVGATDTVTIAPADASNSAKMPAVGILDATLAVNDFGYIITGGFMDNITTSPIDGTTPSSNDTVYVKAGGGLTMTKPTGSSNLIQNIAKVGKVSGGNAGSLIVSSILRTNDVPNLSTGKIWVGDGNTIESTVVHLDETNGRMGIGTTSPSTLLQLSSNNPVLTLTDTESTYRYAGLALTTNNGSWNLSNGDSTTAANSNLYITRNSYGSDNRFIFHRDAYYFGVYDNTNTVKAVIRADGGNSYFSRGNVGIGITAPVSKLHVYNNDGQTSTAAGITVEQDGTGDAVVQYLLTAVKRWTTGIDNSDGDKFKISQNTDLATDNVMTFDTAGNVGIGTSSPVQKVHIDGGSSNAYLHFSNTDTGASASDGADIGITVDEDLVVWNREARNLRLATSGIERMRINSSGNVGIGTASPISGGGNAKWVTIDGVNGSSYSGGIIYSIGGSAKGYHYVGNNNIIHQAQAGLGHRFLANAGDAMIITSTGNVGIGTTSPQVTLDVAGSSTNGKSLQVRSGDIYNGTDSAQIIFSYGGNSYNSNGYAHSIRTRHNSAQASTNAIDFYIWTPSDSANVLGTNRVMTIDGSGNVGIGTTSPDTILEVVGENPILTVRDTSTGLSSANAVLRLAESGSGDTLGNYWDLKMKPEPVGGTANFAIANNSLGEVLNINYQGNVGIGTTSPLTKLQVGGGTADDAVRSYFSDGTYAEMRGYGLQFSRNASYIRPTADNTKILYLGSANAQWNTLSIDASTTAFNTNGSENMRIDSNGNVGIGVIPEAWSVFNPVLRIGAGGSLAGTGVGNFRMFANTYYYGSYKRIGSGFATQYEQDGYHAWYTAASGAANSVISWSERMRIDSSGNVLINRTGTSGYGKLNVEGGADFTNGNVLLCRDAGSVGIGTASPTRILHSKGGSGISTVGKFEGGTANAYIQICSTGQSDTDSGYIGYDSSRVMTFWTANTERLRINSSGGVSINSTTALGYYLYVNGSAAKSTGTTWINTSDERTKENIQNYTKGLNDIVQLQPRIFDYNGKGSTEKSKENIGLIAQEVIDVYPEAIGTFKAKLDETDAKETDIYNLDFHSISISMINAIKELNEKVKILEDKIQILENQENK